LLNYCDEEYGWRQGKGGFKMQTKTKYEEQILNEMRDLPEMIQEKMVKIIHFFRFDILETKLTKEKATEEFLSVCGTWEDDRSVEKQIKEVYSSRRSTSRTEKIF